LRRTSLAPDDASSLPELLVAATLTLVAIGMLGSTVLGPLAVIARSGTVDLRQLELEWAADRAINQLSLARPALTGPALLEAGPARIELREGDLRVARTVAVVLHSGRLTIDSDVLVEGLDLERSHFTFRSAAGVELTTPVASQSGSAADGADRADIAVIEVTLADPPEDDGAAGRTVTRTVGLRLRLPLAAQVQR